MTDKEKLDAIRKWAKDLKGGGNFMTSDDNEWFDEFMDVIIDMTNGKFED